MRKSTGVVLGAATVGLGVAVAGRLRSGRGVSGPELATFSNGMAYARFGVGAKTLLWIQDPGHAGHEGPYLRMMATVVRPLVDAGYTVFLVGHRPHLQPGCTLADLGDDYAELIVEEFDGRVDVVVGDSGGGMIGLTLAAGHPDRFGHIAIVAAGRVLSDAVRVATVESARLLAVGRRTEAAGVMVAVMFPQVRVGWAQRLMAFVVGRVSFPADVEPGDVVAGAEALSAFDGREVLPSIAVPVLLVGGDRDRSVSEEIYRETAGLIPDCTLRIYAGKGHLGTISNPQLPRDVLDFVAASVPGTGTMGARAE
jgi:pimeloyl-ACP methyl ester carboxylesterase